MEGPRSVKKEELQDLTNLINYVFRTSSNKEPDMHICFPIFISEQNLDNLLVFVDETTQKPVSHMGTWINDFNYFGEPMKVGYLGSVCTHPDFQGQGLASRLLDEVFNHLENNGVDILLVSGGRGLYQRAGCKRVGEVKWHNISKQDTHPKFDVAIDPPVEYLNELWLNEPMRTKRGLDNFKTLVEAAALARCVNAKSKVYLAKTGDTPLAYIQGLHTKDGSIMIYEWAGDRSVLIELASYIANTCQNETRWPVPSWEKTLLSLLPSINASVTKTDTLSGTYKIIRFAPFIDKISSYLTELYGAKKLSGFDEENRQVLLYENERIALNPEDMLTMLLSGKLPNNLPPKMQQLFEKALPLPLPWPIGFDYI